MLRAFHAVAPGADVQIVATAEQVRQAEAFRALVEGSEITLGQLALRYAITPAGVSAAIPGARTLEQLEQNVAASNGVGLGAAELAQIADIQRQLGL